MSDFSVGHYKPVNSKAFLNNCHEYIFQFTKHSRTKIDKLAVGVPYQDKSNIKRWNSKGDLRDRGNTWFIPYETIRESRPHPATYPVRLPEMCIKLHGIDETDLVMDPFMGIGTTALACIELDIDYIGFEIDEGYIEIASDRIMYAKMRREKRKGRKKTTKTKRDTTIYRILLNNLPPEELEEFLKPVEGRGGFQSLMRRLHKQYDAKEEHILLSARDIDTILQYYRDHGQGRSQNPIGIILERLKEVHGSLDKRLE